MKKGLICNSKTPHNVDGRIDPLQTPKSAASNVVNTVHAIPDVDVHGSVDWSFSYSSTTKSEG